MKSKANSNIKDEIRSKSKKVNLEGFLAKDFLKNEFNQSLLKGESAGASSNWKEINAAINTFLNTETLELYIELENKINELIPENAVQTVQAFIAAQSKVSTLEDEVRRLEREKHLVPNRESIAGQMKIMELEIEIDRMKVELDDLKKVYFKEYKTALEYTNISRDLAIMVNEVRNIHNEFIEAVMKERELLNAKSLALQNLLKNFRPMEDLKDMIDSKLSIGGSQADLIIKSAENGVPFVQALVKR